MAGNSFGQLFRLTTFGESHGKALGGIIDGCPAGITLDLEKVQEELNRRKPGQSAIVTQRKEPDTVEIYSGVFEGKTTGNPHWFCHSQYQSEVKGLFPYQGFVPTFPCGLCVR